MNIIKKLNSKVIIFIVILSFLFNLKNASALALNADNPADSEYTTNYTTQPNLTLEESKVSGNVVHTIRWNPEAIPKNPIGFKPMFFNRITFRYKNVPDWSEEEILSIIQTHSLQDELKKLPWSYATLPLTAIKNLTPTDEGEVTINFSSILQDLINNDSDIITEKLSDFKSSFDVVTQVVNRSISFGFSEGNLGYNPEKALDYADKLEYNSHYFLSTINYGDLTGAFCQFDRIEYFVTWVTSHSYNQNVNDLQPAADGLYHYKVDGPFVYYGAPWNTINGYYTLGFSKPVAILLDENYSGYNPAYLKPHLYKFPDGCVYNINGLDKSVNIVNYNVSASTNAFLNRNNINWDNVNDTLVYNDININSIITPLSVTSRYINANAEPNLKGKINYSYNEFWAYKDASKDKLRQSYTVDKSYNSYFYILNNPIESHLYGGSIPVFTDENKMNAYLNGEESVGITEEFNTPVIPVLKSFNDESEKSINTSQSNNSANNINNSKEYINNVTNQTYNDDDDDIIKLLKDIFNVLQNFAKQLLGSNTILNNIYDILNNYIENINGTLSNIDNNFKSFLDYFKSLTFDTSSDDKPDLTNFENLLTNILNAIDIPDYSDKLTEILNAIDIPDYNDKLTEILNAIDIPDYSDKLTEILNAIDIPDYTNILNDIKSTLNDVKSTLNDILDKLDNLEVKVKNVFDTGILENIVNLFEILSEDYNVDVDKKFPFCFFFALMTFCGALVAEPSLPAIHIPNHVEIFGYNLNLSLNQTFDIFNQQLKPDSFAMTLNDFGEFIRIVILLIFIYNFGLFVFDTVRKVE
ncbi:MAG: hypothetical protein K6G28_04595 [Acholeplasmatales bacterium]|nr:hypothetical protein [Acholeplasmatales bacterium]